MKESMKEYSIPFAAWELRLYLDTHPDDEKALQAYRRLCAECGNEPCNYACAGTGVCQKLADRRDGRSFAAKTVWSWIEGPWPWEPEANGVRAADSCGCAGDIRRGGNK